MQLAHAKATWRHALSHLIRYHYFLQLAAQMLQMYPPFGYWVCKHPLILCTFLLFSARTLGIRFVKNKFHNPQDFMRAYSASTECSPPGSVCVHWEKSVSFHVFSVWSQNTASPAFVPEALKPKMCPIFSIALPFWNNIGSSCLRLRDAIYFSRKRNYKVHQPTASTIKAKVFWHFTVPHG